MNLHDYGPYYCIQKATAKNEMITSWIKIDKNSREPTKEQLLASLLSDNYYYLIKEFNNGKAVRTIPCQYGVPL